MRSSDRDRADTVIARRGAAPVRRAFRGAASIFAASTPGLDVTTRSGKAEDRTPRWITTAPGDDGRCEVDIEHVAVPPEVLRRDPIQAEQRGVVAPGLAVWLEEHGYRAPDRRYLVLVDPSGLDDAAWWNAGYVTAFAQDPMSPMSYFGSPCNADGGEPGRACVRPRDTSTDSPSNAGGFNAFVAVLPRDWRRRSVDGMFSSRTAWGSQVIAHETMHTLGVNLLAPHRTADGHLRDRFDLLEDTAADPDRDQCAGLASEGEASRFDCAHDDYWGRTGPHSRAGWTERRWSAAQNQYLWGAAQQAPADRVSWTVGSNRYDCADMGGVDTCVD